MSLLATRQDFEPVDEMEGATALYYDSQTGASYFTDPGMIETFRLRIESLRGRFTPNNQKLAIWGCGPGRLVSLAVTAGYDAHGFDASQWAITRGGEMYPAIASRLHLRNATVSADMTPARRDAGLQGAQRFALLLTDDLFTCLTDTEITTALPLLRAICSANLGHIVTPLDPYGQAHGADQRVNWKTAEQWKTLLSPPDLVLDANGMAL